ncbi:MAG: trypsin-like peptidase domain-containing protein [Planctomycetota bacterium]
MTRLLLVLMIHSVLIGCNRRETPEPMVKEMAGAPFAVASEAPPGEHSATTFPPGECALCDLYYSAREAVIRVRVDNGQGSGAVVRSDGLIVTNAHVVGDASAVQVETWDGTIYQGQVVYASDDIDLALVKVVSGDRTWPTIALRGDAPVRIGMDVYVIGHPVGLGWTISRGIVSAERSAGEVAPIPMLQTDAAISPGNSGGPLVDGEGNVLGIMVAKIVAPGAENIALAIPVDAVAAFIDEHAPDA